MMLKMLTGYAPAKRKAAVVPEPEKPPVDPVREAALAWCAKHGWSFDMLRSRKFGVGLTPARYELVTHLRGLGFAMRRIANVMNRKRPDMPYLTKKIEPLASRYLSTRLIETMVAERASGATINSIAERYGYCYRTVNEAVQKYCAARKVAA